MRNHRRTPVRFLALLGALAVIGVGEMQETLARSAAPATSSALSAGIAADVSRSDVFWNWDPATVAGHSTLVRTDAGVSFTYHTTGLPPGDVVTVWLVVFNNPENCSTRPCTGPGDVFKAGVQGDFLYGGGHVIGGDGRGNFGGHLPVGDPSGSGLIELGMGNLALGLLKPRTAEIHLALHSHGPAGSGQLLKAQLSSFLGGCQTFLGPDGIADSPDDMPDAVGECSTFQYSVHD
jgi:hypothetical protein